MPEPDTSSLPTWAARIAVVRMLREFRREQKALRRATYGPHVRELQAAGLNRHDARIRVYRPGLLRMGGVR